MVSFSDLPPDLHGGIVDDRHTERFARNYDRQLIPWQREWLEDLRRELLAPLTGTVLEIGAGSGLNLPHYRSARRVVACEPSPTFRQQLRGRLTACPCPAEIRDWTAEDLDVLPAGLADHVVATLVLCSVQEPERVARALTRTLRPGGTLVVVEHVAAGGLRGVVQRVVAPLSVRYWAGCHPHRHTGPILAQAGFDLSTWRRVDPGGWWYEYPIMAGSLLGPASAPRR